MKTVSIKDILILLPEEIEGALKEGIITPNESRKLDRYSVLSLVTAKKICEKHKESILEETAVITSTFYGAINTMTKEVLKYSNGGLVSPIFITKILPNMQAAVISIALGMKGKSCNISTLENSSCDAMIDAFEELKNNHEKSVLIVCSDSSPNDYIDTIRRCQGKVITEHREEYAAAILLEGNERNGKVRIDDVETALITSNGMETDFIKSWKRKGQSIEHGIYIPESDYFIEGKSNLCLGGARTILDIQYGIDYCRKSRIANFSVFSIMQNKFYSKLDIGLGLE